MKRYVIGIIVLCLISLPILSLSDSDRERQLRRLAGVKEDWEIAVSEIQLELFKMKK